MKSLLIVYSYHHMNTLKIASSMAEVLGSDIKTPEEAKDINLEEYDLIGFGAGIDSGKHYKQLLDFANEIDNNVKIKKCFIFSTSAVQGDKKVKRDHKCLRNILLEKGYDVIENEFSCKGFNTNLFLKYFGGMNKNRPDSNDFEKAKQFALEIKELYNGLNKKL